MGSLASLFWVKILALYKHVLRLKFPQGVCAANTLRAMGVQGRHAPAKKLTIFMISISKLYCGLAASGDALRYGRGASEVGKKPVVVWNITNRCNLRCQHCYASATPEIATPEIDTAGAKAVIEDLAAFGVPVLLFSGGEPLLREDLTELVAFSVQKGLRVALSSNGTLFTLAKAQELRGAGLAYAGISLDGLADVHNTMRGVAGTFELTLQGLEQCRAAGLKTGLRLTLTRHNQNQLQDIFQLLVEREIGRICFYHLVPSGRGRAMAGAELSHAETRQALDLILSETRRLHEAGLPKEVLTVDNHADGAYLWLKLREENAAAAATAYKLLRQNGGNSSGLGIACIDAQGQVLPDQFWRSAVLGNINRRPFSAIWQDSSLPLLSSLRQRPRPLTGRCAACCFLNICNGNLRARGATPYDIWAPDPSCYLTDQEITGQEITGQETKTAQLV